MDREPKTLNASALARYLGWSRPTFYARMRDGRFPVEPIIAGKRKVWSTAMVDEWLNRGR